MSLDFSLYAVRRTEVFDTNFTHNAVKMAAAAGIYDCLWRAPENNFTHAHQITETLRLGIEQMKADPEKFRALEAENGWGTFRQFLPWVEKIHAACVENPDAEIETSR